MDKKKVKSALKKTWWFIWEDDSIWSWIVNIILAFVLIKFIVYPGLGLLFSTSYPIVAVVSGSMEHDGSFNNWWSSQQSWYVSRNITQEEFSDFRFKNGFNKGDIMILYGKKPKDIQIGDVVVFRSARPDPIIHRVVKEWELNGKYYFQTKGDHNSDSITSVGLDETNIPEDNLLGKAVVRVPLLGYIKIWFVEIIQLVVR
ncbi:MAG: signal peptidase I [Nanoarchaeota archaeon]|nr:signal peptidase I [Nanoarchaeota archaeon]MBU1004199.1 signal peptidase I [Nanoarchaeota archaeon]MBU1945349.1 signal peptidase I [Nanoarchaeota archaeon]